MGCHLELSCNLRRGFQLQIKTAATRHVFVIVFSLTDLDAKFYRYAHETHL
jgi:hypothetical protein